jgi:hypothetical protein
LGVLFAIIVYNYTEAAFKNIHLVWTLFHLIAIDYVVDAATVPETAATIEPVVPVVHKARKLPAAPAAARRRYSAS